MPGSPRIRAASDAIDLDTARRLFVEYQRGLGEDLAFQDFASELDSLPGPYAPPGGAILLAFSGALAIGCVALKPLMPGAGEMKRLYLRPEARGQGLGRQLVTRIEAEAARLGYERIMLDTLDRLTAAVALYRELGYRPCPAYYDNPLPGAIYLEKPLAAGASLGAAS